MVESAAKPVAQAPATNRVGLTLADYKGAPSTLCDGCGHDAIACHQLPPVRL
jgi:hypothetical protein